MLFHVWKTQISCFFMPAEVQISWLFMSGKPKFHGFSCTRCTRKTRNIRWNLKDKKGPMSDGASKPKLHKLFADSRFDKHPVDRHRRSKWRRPIEPTVAVNETVPFLPAHSHVKCLHMLVIAFPGPVDWLISRFLYVIGWVHCRK